LPMPQHQFFCEMILKSNLFFACGLVLATDRFFF